MPYTKGGNLTFDDRCVIEERVKENKSFREIARALNVSPTTVSEEIKNNRVFYISKQMPGQAQSRCGLYNDCRVTDLCPQCTSKAAACKRCKQKHCFDFCKEFDPYICPDRERAPFVCDGCSRRRYCTREKARYVASKAQVNHDNRLRNAHTGISCEPKDLEKMVNVAKKLMAQGQSPEAIWAVHGDEFPVGVRTFYNYVSKGVMGLTNIDLPKKIVYAPRKKRIKGEPKMSLEGRTYADWQNLPEDMKLRTVQIDCVEGLRRNSKCILTLHFVRLFFQLHILLPSKTQDHVKEALDAIETYCEGRFTEAFPVILGDRGSEFLDFLKIETGLDGSRRTQMFYCDPVKPGQKGACEKNHEELRRIIPKGTDLDKLEQWDIALACSHVNSYVRAGQGIAPVALASLVLPANLLECLGITAISPDDVVMKPRLLGL